MVLKKKDSVPPCQLLAYRNTIDCCVWPLSSVALLNALILGVLKNRFPEVVYVDKHILLE